MASKTIQVGKLTRGTDVTLSFEITTTVDIPEARLVIKKKIKDPDTPPPPVVNKLITTTANPDGEITGTVPTITASFFLTKVETMKFKADVDYFLDVEVFDTNDNSTIPVGGTIAFTERVRTATG